MERLTEHSGDSVFIKGCKTLYANQERKGAPASNAIVRLAAYEDAMPLERVQKIAQAEKSGRLIVFDSTNNKDQIIQYLKYSHVGARAMKDFELTCLLERAIFALTYDELPEEVKTEIKRKIMFEISQPNDPLTLDELLEMDGMPVWCVDGIGNQCWGIVSNEHDGHLRCYNTKTAYWEARFYKMKGNGVCGLHEIGWIAYRRKPEGDAK